MVSVFQTRSAAWEARRDLWVECNIAHCLLDLSDDFVFSAGVKVVASMS